VFRTRAAWSAVIVLAAAAVLARLPQLLSPNLLAEGDECLVGIMGIHVARGHDFPFFFYGQKYGLAIVEAPVAALSFAIFGVGPIALKGAILVIWIAGAVFYFRAFARVLGTARSFWITLLLVLMPAWAATSMKAWSGYVTAFAASGLVIDLVARPDHRRAVRWIAAGATTAVVYFAQPLWLPGLVPIVLYHLVVTRRVRDWGAYVCATAIPIAAMAVVKRYWLAGAEVWYTPDVGNPHLLASVPSLIKQVYVTLTGSFYFWQTVVPGPITTTVAAFWSGLLVVLLALHGYRLIARRPLTWSYLLAASIVLTIVSNWLLLDARDARYMMALNAPLVFLAGVELFDAADRFRVPFARCVAAILVVAVVEAAAMREFAGYTFMWWTNTPGSPSETKSLKTVIGYLESRGITRVYSTNELLEWQIAFYSDEAVIARSRTWLGRYPKYIVAVDRALETGRPVAIVGYTGFTHGLEKLVADPKAIVDIDGKYFVYLAPDRELLTRAGFRLVR
jgi:hypothetical protein